MGMVAGEAETMTLSGAIAGGITSSLSGGNFWQGVGQGALSGALSCGADALLPTGSIEEDMIQGKDITSDLVMNGVKSGAESFALGRPFDPISFVGSVIGSFFNANVIKSKLNTMTKIYEAFSSEHPDVTQVTHDDLVEFAQKYNLSEPDLLWLSARIAHDDSRYNPNGGPTKCNMYIARVFELYTGNTDLDNLTVGQHAQGDNPATGQVSVLERSWACLGGLAAGVDAQGDACQGKFVVAVSTSPEEHIAIIMPGVGEITPDNVYCPAIAQQGSSNLLYGYTKNGYLDWGFGIKNNNSAGYNVQYYEYGGN